MTTHKGAQLIMNPVSSGVEPCSAACSEIGHASETYILRQKYIFPSFQSGNEVHQHSVQYDNIRTHGELQLYRFLVVMALTYDSE